MPFQHCRHIKEDGFFCQAPALRGREYCRFHLRSLGRRMRMARALAQREPYRIVLPLLEDMNAVQVATMQVLDALGAGLLEEKRAKLMLYGLRQASINLRSIKAAPSLAVPAEQAGTGIRAEEYPGFEEEFGLPPDLDLSRPPEVAFPAAAAADNASVVGPSPYRSKPFRHDEIGPEDVELEEIYRTQGEDAYRQREKELNAKAIKEVLQRKSEIKRAKYVVEAARRNEERMFGTPEERAQNAAEVQGELAEAQAQYRAKLEAEAAAAEQGGEVDRKPPATAEEGSEVARKSPAAADAASLPPAKSGTE